MPFMKVDTVRVAPSLLSANFAHLGTEIRSVVDGGADLLHLDVMDGHFVPNITFGPPLVKSVRKAAPKTILDCHLMVTNPSKFVDAFVDAGANWVSVHVEAPDDIPATLSRIRSRGAQAGLVLNPDTPIDRARPFLDKIDYLLVMSVHPGFGGQKFMPEVLAKVRGLRVLGYRGTVEIDGGIDEETAPLAVGAGCQVLVAGTAVFGKLDRAAAIQALRTVA
jgi:ribulose-phosphate 3-epimerase